MEFSITQVYYKRMTDTWVTNPNSNPVIQIISSPNVYTFTVLN